MGRGTHRGFITYEELSKSLGKRNLSDENLSQAFIHILDENITLVEKKSDFKVLRKKENSNKEEGKTIEKSDDPIRMYLREMGGVELLSREGEIAIAKRIEAGRERMIGAICESPMTIRSIINWKESIKEGTMLLRDIVDLEQTYDVTDIDGSKIDETLKIIEGGIEKPKLDKIDKKIKETKEKNKIPNDKDAEDTEDGEEKEDDEEDSLNVSLAAMEEKLKPKILKDFDEITKLFKKLQKYSLDLMNADKKNQSKFSQVEKKYKKIRKEMVSSMKEVHFNASTIEALMESLYELNKKLLFRQE